jgi:DNA-binding CsgD family transcriptional regulator
MQSFAQFAQAAAFQLCDSHGSRFDDSMSLTRAECEALRWTREGNSAFQVGLKMSTSGEIAAIRIDGAMKKLHSASKYEAVLKAMRLGLIECA